MTKKSITITSDNISEILNKVKKQLERVRRPEEKIGVFITLYGTVQAGKGLLFGNRKAISWLKKEYKKISKEI